MENWFGKVATSVSKWAGSSYAFIASIAMVLVWGVFGPMMNYSDTWQLLINTPTTVITFWMVFLIQNTQNRDMLALHIKLDEILNKMQETDSNLTDVEDFTMAELEEIREERKKEG